MPPTSGQRSMVSVLPPLVLRHQILQLARYRWWLPSCERATNEEISDIFNKSTPKHCELDPLYHVASQRGCVRSCTRAPLLCNLCNASLTAGVIPTPASQKHAIVRHLLKKPTLNVDDFSSYALPTIGSWCSRTCRLSRKQSNKSLLQDYYITWHSSTTPWQTFCLLLFPLNGDGCCRCAQRPRHCRWCRPRFCTRGAAGPQQCLRHRCKPDPGVGAAAKIWLCLTRTSNSERSQST